MIWSAAANSMSRSSTGTSISARAICTAMTRSSAAVSRCRKAVWRCHDSRTESAAASAMRITALTQRVNCPEKISASTPSAASASVMTRWTKPNLTSLPLQVLARGGLARGCRVRRAAAHRVRGPLRLAPVELAFVDPVDERQEAKDRVRAQVLVAAHPLAERRADQHAVAPLDVRHGARRDLADAPLELLGERVAVRRPRRRGRAHRVDAELHVRARLPRALAEDELVAERALPPVDVPRIVPVAHGPERVGLVPGAATIRGG